MVEITRLLLPLLEMALFPDLAFLKQCSFGVVLTSKSALGNIKMGGFGVWVPKKNHSNCPGFLFLTIPPRNGFRFDKWIQLKNRDFYKFHWKDWELVIKSQEDPRFVSFPWGRGSRNWLMCTGPAAPRHPQRGDPVLQGETSLLLTAQHPPWALTYSSGQLYSL